MKIKTHTFRHPVTVLQIYRNIYTYTKEEKSFNNRKELAQWPALLSKSGFINNHQLYLPESILNEPHFNNCSLLTIEDNVTSFHHTLPNNHPKKSNQCFTSKIIKLDIFKLLLHEFIELHLEYGYFEVGTPERDNFQLCNLAPYAPVEIKINGKTDASLTARRDRNFKEQHYIYENLGLFKQCHILKEPWEPQLKTVPANTQVINLMKPLW